MQRRDSKRQKTWKCIARFGRHPVASSSLHPCSHQRRRTKGLEASMGSKRITNSVLRCEIEEETEVEAGLVGGVDAAI